MVTANFKDGTTPAVEPVIKTFQKVKAYLPTLSPSQYNYYKPANQPTARTIIEKTWEQILQLLGLPLPLDRDTLSRLSQSLHVLEKQLVRTLGLGWDETTFTIINHKKLKPDSFYLERAYFQNNQILILDVKLSVCSAPLTVYKYLPIFENPPVPTQMTFFPDWIPEETVNSEPGIQIDRNGQMGLFWENNILYICYLVGSPQKNFLPGSEISCGRVSTLKKKKLPPNMEIRFIEFKKMPELYCQIAGIPYDQAAVRHILDIAEDIKQVVLTLPPDASRISREIYKRVKFFL